MEQETRIAVVGIIAEGLLQHTGGLGVFAQDAGGM